MDRGTPTPCWEILLVDDEEDIHLCTQLELKRRSWRGRPFRLTSCRSAKEAREVLLATAPPPFSVALVDVVMETPTAGLELCQLIRAKYPRSMRLILRTGQPGTAPAEQVLNDYDIDYYLHKPEATGDRLYATLRACLRTSQDIATIGNISELLARFALLLQSGEPTRLDLAQAMAPMMGFLEAKHGVRLSFVLGSDGEGPDSAIGSDVGVSVEQACDALGQLRVRTASPTLCPGSAMGLPGEVFVWPLASDDRANTSPGAPAQSGLIARFRAAPGRQTLDELQYDMTVVTEHWYVAERSWRDQRQAARDRMLRECMVTERMEGIATAVGGVAHDIGTPLGVANIANSTVASLLAELNAAKGERPEAEVLADLADCSQLIGRNLERAHALIKSFTRVTAGQARDALEEVSLVDLVRDCIETMRPETRRHHLEVVLTAAPGVDFRWLGYAGQLSQVVINFFQNAIRYAYPDATGGQLDLRLHALQEGRLAPGFRLEFEDYGRGIAPQLLPEVFKPFVTTGRDRGGTGLGLAVSQNIVTKNLGGAIACRSEEGKGTIFVVEFPLTVPNVASEAIEQPVEQCAGATQGGPT